MPDYLAKYPNIITCFCPKVEVPNSRISVYAAANTLRLGDLIVRSGALNLIPKAGHSLSLITNGLNFIWGIDNPFEIQNSQPATKKEKTKKEKINEIRAKLRAIKRDILYDQNNSDEKFYFTNLIDSRNGKKSNKLKKKMN